MTASEHTELLPCPHCHGKAIQSRESDQWLEHYHHYFIRCSECSAQSAKFHANVDDSHGAVQKAIAAWNRRALPDGAEPVPVAVTDDMVKRFDAVFYARHERGFLMRPLIDPPDTRAALTAALHPTSETTEVVK
jgi:Lar family restriction alleviation protein